jgi:hypothetical protein
LQGSTSGITAPVTPESGISLSPPFILATAVSSAGIIAAGTADGQLWIGADGEKDPARKKKRTRKWEGLSETRSLATKIADGPVVALYVFLQTPIRLLRLLCADR